MPAVVPLVPGIIANTIPRHPVGPSQLGEKVAHHQVTHAIGSGARVERLNLKQRPVLAVGEPLIVRRGDLVRSRTVIARALLFGCTGLDAREQARALIGAPLTDNCDLR